MERFNLRLPAGRMPPVMRQEHALENYHAEFPQTVVAFEYFLRRCRIPAPNQAGQPVGVAVMPWVATPMPWYSLTLAIGLARRGRRVQLVWDDIASPRITEFWQQQDRALAAMLDHLRRHFEVVRLSELAPHASLAGDRQVLERLANSNLIWDVRGRTILPHETAERENYCASLGQTLAGLRTLTRTNSYAYWLVPGGVRASSGVFLQVARETGRRASTYDAGLGWLLVSSDGVAGHQTDVGRAFMTLWQEGRNAIRPWMREAAEREFEKRLESKDRTSFQLVQSSGADPSRQNDVLIPLNVEWDTAALDRHHVFHSTTEWVTSAVAFILANHPGRVIVRQHPSERRPLERSRLDLDVALRERFGDEPRLSFVRAEDPVSSYDLMQQASLVLPFVSTIAIEAAALGKPVLVSGVSYYSDLGFVWSARTRDEYFELLGRGLKGELPLKPDQLDKAWLCYYLTQIHNRTWTDFTPQPPDFWRWVRRAPDELFADPVVNDILTAMDENIPLSLIRHRRYAATFEQ